MRDSLENRRCPLCSTAPPHKVTEETGRRQRKGLAQPLGLAPSATLPANLHMQNSLVHMRHVHNCPFALRNHLGVIFVSMCGFQTDISFVLWISLILKPSNHCHVVSEALWDSVFLLKMRMRISAQFTTHECHDKNPMSLGTRNTLQR